jgi:hypothetical protein
VIAGIVTGLVAAIIALIVSLVWTPIARCPDGYYVNGVRPSGRSTCREVPPTRDCGEPKWSPPCPEPRTFPVRIYCTGGSVPLVLDDATIGCMRR